MDTTFSGVSTQQIRGMVLWLVGWLVGGFLCGGGLVAVGVLSAYVPPALSVRHETVACATGFGVLGCCVLTVDDDQGGTEEHEEEPCDAHDGEFGGDSCDQCE